MIYFCQQEIKILFSFNLDSHMEVFEHVTYSKGTNSKGTNSKWTNSKWTNSKWTNSKWTNSKWTNSKLAIFDSYFDFTVCSKDSES